MTSDVGAVAASGADARAPGGSVSTGALSVGSLRVRRSVIFTHTWSGGGGPVVEARSTSMKPICRPCTHRGRLMYFPAKTDPHPGVYRVALRRYASRRRYSPFGWRPRPASQRAFPPGGTAYWTRAQSSSRPYASLTSCSARSERANSTSSANFLVSCRVA